jgi:hypothetical protein
VNIVAGATTSQMWIEGNIEVRKSRRHVMATEALVLLRNQCTHRGVPSSHRNEVRIKAMTGYAGDLWEVSHSLEFDFLLFVASAPRAGTPGRNEFVHFFAVATHAEQGIECYRIGFEVDFVSSHLTNVLPRLEIFIRGVTTLTSGVGYWSVIIDRHWPVRHP